MKYGPRKHHPIIRSFFCVLTAAVLLSSPVSRLSVLCASAETSTAADSAAAVSTVSDYQNWKQYSSAWSSMPVGTSGGTMKTIGCAVTSAAILCASSGSAIPEGFDPGVLCRFLSNNGGFSSAGDLQWTVITKLVPDFSFVSRQELGTKVQNEQILKLASYINEGYYVSVMIRKPDYVVDGKTYRGSTHFVAIDRIEDGVVYMFDPGSGQDSLYTAYDAATLESVRLFRGGEAPAPVTPEDSVAPDYADGGYYTTDNLNLRSEPSVGGEIHLSIPNGSYIDITEVAGEWGKCTWNELDGWVCLRYCTPAIAMYTTGKYCTDGNSLTIRSAPSASSGVAGYLQPETTFTVTQVKGSWGYCTVDEKSGWVCLRYCSCADSYEETVLSVQYTTGENCMRLRAAATTQSDTLALLGTDTVFTVTQIDGDWGLTEYQEQTGWVHLGYCTEYADATPDTPEDNGAALQYYSTGSNCLRLRAEASADSDTLAFIGTNTVFAASEISGDWGKTEYQGKIGWVHLGYCTLQESDAPEDVPPVEEEETPARLWPAGTGHCVVVASGLNVRQSGDVTGKWIGRLGRGDEVNVLSCEGDWARVEWQDGSGWICLGENGTPYVYRYGDLTLDGVCDAADIALMGAFFNGVAMLTEVQRLAADMNADGIINYADVTLLGTKGA